MSQQVIQPMVKFQRQVHSLVTSDIIKPTDSIWKIALLYGDEWPYWKQQLLEFDFSMQDPRERVDSCRSLGRGITEETEDWGVGEKFRGDRVNFLS